MRSLLVEAAWALLRSRRPDTLALRTWALRIAGQRGKGTAVVALARRLAGILYALWRDDTDYGVPCARRGGGVAAGSGARAA